MADSGHISGTFLFDPSDKIYLEHFPGRPVVPGSLIVEAFVRAIKNAGIQTKTCGINNFRFKQFISPGEYTFSIKETSSAISCKLFLNEKAAVTGEILI